MSSPWVARQGVILFVENFDASIAFYRDVLQLPVEQVTPDLMRFGVGGGYLMVERGGVASATPKSHAQNPTVLRFNVDDLDAAVAMLRGRGLTVEVKSWSWGTTGSFTDPDGNWCELRDPFSD